METTRKSMSPLALVLLLSAIFFILFLTVSGAMLFYKSSGKYRGGKSSASSAMFGQGSVGIIELNGVIMDSKKVIDQLDAFQDADEVKAVVLRTNTPGGAVAPSQEIYQAVQKFKKPLVVSMGSVTASGGYYIAMGAKKVYANPGTITGSIGVIMEFMNLSKLYDWAKIQRYSIKTGKFKDVGAEYRDMRPDERDLLQGMVNDVLSQFKSAVVQGRHLSPETITALADGRVFSGSQAKALKLVDELGTLDDAINDVALQAKLKGKPHVVYSDHHGKKWWESLLESGSKDDESESSLADRLVAAFSGKSLNPSSLLGALPAGVYWLWEPAR